MFILLFTTILIIFLFQQLYWRRRNLPPGPFPLPIIGNIPFIDTENTEKQLLKWKKKYGNVFTLWLPEPNIIVSDHTLLKEFITKSDVYAGRPTFNSMKLLIEGNYGLLFNEDHFWRSQKRFALHVLRDFGFGKPILEDAIINQCKEMEAYFNEREEKLLDVFPPLNTAVGNIIHHLTFGYSTSLDSNIIVNLRNNILDAIEIFLHPFGMLIELWMGFKYLDPLFGNILKNWITKNDKIVDYIKKELDKHRETINYDNDPRDYMDAFLIEQRRQNNDGKGDDEWSDKQLIGCAYDLFGAGMETTSTTLRTFIMHLIRNQEIQKKIHDEIDTVIGRDRVITMNDQVQLPYLQACIQEVQRVAVLLSMNLQHKTTKDVILDEYYLPEGTIVIPQFQSVHLDGDVFNEPERFDPTRHLDNKGKFVKNDKVTPFSVGKRSCLGESLAKMELFLFSANLLQKFKFLPENDTKLPEFKYVSSFIKSPQLFNCKVQQRL